MKLRYVNAKFNIINKQYLKSYIKIKMTKPKVLLAFSGGLDTSYCVKYLSDERGYEVHFAII